MAYTIILTLTALLFILMIFYAKANSDRQWEKQIEKIMEADKAAHKLKTTVPVNVSDLPPWPLRYIYTPPLVPPRRDAEAPEYGEPPCHDCNRIMAYQFLSGTPAKELMETYGYKKTSFYDTIRKTCAEIQPHIIADWLDGRFIHTEDLSMARLKENRGEFFDETS